jgi:hypothetical protein
MLAFPGEAKAKQKGDTTTKKVSLSAKTVPTLKGTYENSVENENQQRVSPLIIEKALAMRAEGVGWRVISHRLRVSEYVLRCAIEPDYRRHKLDSNVRYRRHLAAKPVVVERPRPVRQAALHHVRSQQLYGPPPEVLAARDLALELRLQPRSVTAQLLGDPLPGRSALDQRRK